MRFCCFWPPGCGGTNDNSNTTGQEQNETNTVPPQEQPPTQPEEPAEPEEPEPDPRQEAIDSLLSGMTLEEKVGQMFFVRCPDVQAAEKVSEYHLGG